MSLLTVFSVIALASAVFAQGYIVPEPTFEILRPSGFKVSIPDDGEISLLAFHGNINEEILNREAGRFSVDIGKPKNGRWTFTDKYTKFSKGDVIYYWLYVLHKNGRGYLREDESYTVLESTKLNDSSTHTDCSATITTASNIGKKLCGGKLIFEDDFVDSVLDRQKWTVEQYIPAYYEDNFEFVSYRDVNECRFISDSKLFLKPIAVSRQELRGELDLQTSCTRRNACYHIQTGAQLLPPVKSGKVTSKMSFRYAKVEIRAKLPVGDWIYPQIELISKNPSEKYPRILIAYARGNERLTLANGEDLGSRLLFGGYLTTSQEPQRSQHLRSIRVSAPVGQDMHVFSVIWKNDKMDFMLDNEIYGTLQDFDMPSEYRVVLGVGVGGVVDFPDDTHSGSFTKPWRNNEAKRLKHFADERNSWMGTWRGDDVALQVDYVRIYAI